MYFMQSVWAVIRKLSEIFLGEFYAELYMNMLYELTENHKIKFVSKNKICK